MSCRFSSNHLFYMAERVGGVKRYYGGLAEVSLVMQASCVGGVVVRLDQGFFICSV